MCQQLYLNVDLCFLCAHNILRHIKIMSHFPARRNKMTGKAFLVNMTISCPFYGALSLPQAAFFCAAFLPGLLKPEQIHQICSR